MSNEHTMTKEQANQENYDAVLRDYNAEVVATVHNVAYTRGQLKAVFELVQNKENWKLPINTTIPVKDIQTLNAILVAVEFYTGSKTSFEFAGFSEAGETLFSVRAIGYYKAVGA